MIKKKPLLERQKDADRIDSLLIRELNDMAYKSTGGVKQERYSTTNDIVDAGRIHFKDLATDEITKERILEYQNELIKPYVNNTTGEVYKYFPSSYPLELADLNIPYQDIPSLRRPANQNDVDTQVRDLQVQETDLRNKKINLGNFLLHKKQLENKFKSKEKQLKKEEDKLPTLSKPAIITKTQQKIADLRTELTTLTNEITPLTNDIAKETKDIQNLENDIININQRITDYTNNIIENQQIERKKTAENKKNVGEYSKLFNALNRNRIQLEQQQGESDIDYFNRVKAIEQERYDMNLYNEKSSLEQVMKLKDNLKLLFRKADLIENIIKDLDDNDRFEVNKYFPAIMNIFLETYGFDNTNLSLNEITKTLREIIDKIKNPIEYEIQNDPTIPATMVNNIYSTPTIDSKVENNALIIENKTINRKLYLKIGSIPTRKNLIFYSKTTNNKGEFVSVKERGGGESNWRKLINDYLQLDAPDYANIFKNIWGITEIWTYLKDVYNLIPLDSTNVNGSNVGPRNWIFGAGITNDDIPAFINFGDIILYLHKLYFKNILSVKSKQSTQLRRIDFFNNAKVSDLFVDIVLRIIRGEKYNDLLDNLKINEKELLDQLLSTAGLHRKLPNTRKTSIEKLKERFLLVQGELMNGNDNPEIFKELKQLLAKLHNLKVITSRELKTYLNQFK